MTAEIVDFDKEFAKLLNPDKKIPTVPLTMFGREWHLIAELNNFTFTRMAGGDTASIGEFITNAVTPDERSEWQRQLAGILGMGADELMAFVRRLIEVVGNAPTTSSSTSPSSASRKTSARKSTGVSSSGRAARPAS